MENQWLWAHPANSFPLFEKNNFWSLERAVAPLSPNKQLTVTHQISHSLQIHMWVWIIVSTAKASMQHMLIYTETVFSFCFTDHSRLRWSRKIVKWESLWQRVLPHRFPFESLWQYSLQIECPSCPKNRLHCQTAEEWNSSIQANNKNQIC